MRRRKTLLCASFLATTLVGASRTASADALGSATWSPGTGSGATLSNGGSATAIQTISNGKVTIVSTLTGSVTQAVIAYALQYDTDNWYKSGTTKYFTLRSEFVKLSTAGSDTNVQAIIPAVNELHFMPNNSSPQSLFVWIGRQGTMTVDPVTGVTGAALNAEYDVTTSLPSLTIIPPDDAIVSGIFASRRLQFLILRSSEATSDDTYTLTSTVPTGLGPALVLPTSVTIPAGFDRAEFDVGFTPRKTAGWPGTGATLAMTATSSFGTVSTNVPFSATLLLPQEDILCADAPVNPMDQYCQRHTTFETATTKTTKLCGACVAKGNAPPPEGAWAGPKLMCWEVPYKCALPGTSCIVTQKNFSAADYAYQSKTEKCKVTVKVKNAQGQEVDQVVDGFRLCYDLQPTGHTSTVKADDCD